MRKMPLVALGIVLLGMGFVVADIASVSAQAIDPRTGTWKLNVAKSTYSPGRPPQSGMPKIEASAQAEKVTAEEVNLAGTLTTTEYTANFDGKDYPLTGVQYADTVSLKRIDARTTERTDKNGGQAVLFFTRIVSQDGKTMTVTVTGTNAQGQTVNNVAVWERQ